MNHEALLASTLSDEKEKLASLSFDELAAIVKTAGLNDRDYMRQKARTFTNTAKDLIKRHGPTAGVAGGAAYVGARMGAKKKESTVAQWGRELAHEDLEKAAIAGPLLSTARAVLPHVGGMLAMGGIKKATAARSSKPFSFGAGGGSRMGATSGIYNSGGMAVTASISNVDVLRAELEKMATLGQTAFRTLSRVAQTAPGKAIGYGAAGGAALNVGRNMMRPREERGSFLGSAVKGGIAGGFAGAAAGPFARKALDMYGRNVTPQTTRLLPSRTPAAQQTVNV